MIRHPYDAVAPRFLATATVVLAVAFGLLTAILFAFVPPEDVSQLRRLLDADSRDAALMVLESWPAPVFRSFSFLLGFDFLYDIVHNNGVAVFAIWGAQRLASGWSRNVASVTAWVMWIDTLLNVFENLAFLSVIQTLDPDPLLAMAQAVFRFRSVTLIMGLGVGLVLHALAFAKSARSAA